MPVPRDTLPPLPPRTWGTRPTPLTSDCAAPSHGTVSATRRGCCCPDALAAAARAGKLRHLRPGRRDRNRVDATGTRRRIAALIAIGYPMRELAGMLDWTRQGVGQFLTRDVVHHRTAARVTALYQPLSGWPAELNPATGHLRPTACTRARAMAARRGYLPPLCWEDVDIDDPAARPDIAALRGQPIEPAAAVTEVLDMVRNRAHRDQVTAAYRAVARVDRAELVAALSDRDGEFAKTADEIGELLGIQRRQVQRYRAAAAHAHAGDQHTADALSEAS